MTTPFAAKSAALDIAAKQCRQAMTLFAPQFAPLSEKYMRLGSQEQHIGMRYCKKCTPPKTGVVCPLCGYAVEHQWQMKVHFAYQPEYCARRFDHKVHAWANKS